jgi:energy-coupling factor transporter ATP-binding protein EcfA2
MVNNPKLIVADEPTGNLDPDTSESIMAMLLEINKNGTTSGNKTTVIICTHDSNLVDRMKQRVIEIDGGLVVRDEKASGYTEERREERPSVITTEDYGNIPGSGLAFGEDFDYSDSYDDQGFEQAPRGFVFGDSAQKAYVPAEEPLPVEEIAAAPEEESGVPEEILLDEEPAPEPEVIEITIPQEPVTEEETIPSEEIIPEPAEEFTFDDEPAAEETAVETSETVDFPTAPVLTDKEQKRAEKQALKEARRAEKQAEKEARRKAKLDGKFKTRSADPNVASDIDMIPEDDD